MPLAEVIRQRLDLIGENMRFVETIMECQVNFRKKDGKEVGGLAYGVRPWTKGW